MSYFPFMIELNNERCLIAGGGTVAYRKVCSMLEFGAVVTVVSPEFCPELLELAWRLCVSDKYSSGHLTLVKRCVQPQDIDGAFVVIMATDDEKVNHDMAELCRQQRILVNVVDVKADCGFYFPAIIKDKEVVISVSTGGQSPVLAGTIKRNIESHLGRSYGDIAERMGELREQIKAQIDGEEERKKAFQQMVRSLLDES
ncbi:precorrin-2 dehydrogenase/sirohydrochlorin ferrochelatase family protein [Coprococcus sp. ART55/1]|jgi:precorrin-2 dehydrogenase/sirohydrochlorin ferrochelatase|uniref:precorrin-2 dehydrogenase/sirohydrochlorin ferrochelatase family protein n=1 Tax=Coprococcus sp. ART55/1 TaxID=751585 RepID=UPI0002F183DC|nr:bifunctional precorrin-2 dehydrogenase/sirohydrochlorin ferrochelatase [Coprococcus sp. ART55/1]